VREMTAGAPELHGTQQRHGAAPLRAAWCRGAERARAARGARAFAAGTFVRLGSVRDRHHLDAACSTSSATAAGCDRKIEWLPATSTVVAPARSAIERWAGGGIIRSSVATRYQLGLLCHAGSLIVPLRASTSAASARRPIRAADSGQPHRSAGCRGSIRAIHDDLQEAYLRTPLYFPFVFSSSRPLRAFQGYLTKFPADALGQTAAEGCPVAGRAPGCPFSTIQLSSVEASTLSVSGSRTVATTRKSLRQICWLSSTCT
jgi:hypothetical protein